MPSLLMVSVVGFQLKGSEINMAIILYQIKNLATGLITNEWTSDVDGPDRYEPGFGKPVRTLTEDASGAVKDIDGSDANIALATATGTDADGHKTYQMPAEYELIQTDITAQVAAQKLLEKGLAAQAVGAGVVAQVWAINQGKYAAGTLTDANLQAIVSDATLQTIERLLWNGSLEMALALINSYSSPYFSASDIATIIAPINVFLAL